MGGGGGSDIIRGSAAAILRGTLKRASSAKCIVKTSRRRVCSTRTRHASQRFFERFRATNTSNLIMSTFRSLAAIFFFFFAVFRLTRLIAGLSGSRGIKRGWHNFGRGVARVFDKIEIRIRAIAFFFERRYTSTRVCWVSRRSSAVESGRVRCLKQLNSR